MEMYLSPNKASSKMRCNLLGVDVMVGHWEFTYKEKEVLKNVGFFKGDFLGQNVRILEDALLGDKYISMTEKYHA
jgi:sulfur-oxidizing protein SoxB